MKGGYDRRVPKLALEVARYRQAMAEGGRLPVGPPALVECKSKSVAELARAVSTAGWKTGRDDLSLAAAQTDLGGVDDIVALEDLVAADGELYFVDKGTENSSPHVCVGRAKRNDIIIKDPRVSTLHAMVTLEDGEWVLSDQRSANGTFVNGRRLEPSQLVSLKTGDCVRFGNRAFYFLDGDRLRDFLELRSSSGEP